MLVSKVILYVIITKRATKAKQVVTITKRANRAKNEQEQKTKFYCHAVLFLPNLCIYVISYLVIDFWCYLKLPRNGRI